MFSSSALVTRVLAFVVLLRIVFILFCFLVFLLGSFASYRSGDLGCPCWGVIARLQSFDVHLFMHDRHRPFGPIFVSGGFFRI